MIRKVTRADGTPAYDARYGRGAQRRFDTKGLAQEYVDSERLAARRSSAGLEVQREAVTFDELYVLWWKNYNPSAWRQSMLAHVRARWGKVPVRAIKPEAFGAWLHSLEKAEKTKKHILESARQVFNAGVEWGYLASSPARPRAFRAPTGARVREIRPFESWDEVDRVSGALPTHAASFVRFCCATGIRVPGEALKIRWCDIDRAGWTVTVRGTKTKNAARTIPLSTQAWDAIVLLARPIDKTEPVFRLDYAAWRRYDWPLALEQAGLPKRTPYEMRHTFATLALEAGASIDDVSQALGHGDIGITLTYYRKWTRPMLDRLRGVLNTIGEEQDAAIRADRATGREA